MASGMDGSTIGAIVDKVTFVNKVGLETNFIYSPLVIFYFYLHYSHCLDEIGRKFLSCGAPLRWHSSQQVRLRTGDAATFSCSVVSKKVGTLSLYSSV